MVYVYQIGSNERGGVYNTLQDLHVNKSYFYFQKYGDANYDVVLLVGVWEIVRHFVSLV